MKSSRPIDSEQKVINNIVNTVRDYLHPERIILFGSRVYGKGKQYSDFDIAVEGAEIDIRKERLLKDALDERVGILTVDLINLDKVDREFKRLILKHGRVIYES